MGILPTISRVGRTFIPVPGTQRSLWIDAMATNVCIGWCWRRYRIPTKVPTSCDGPKHWTQEPDAAALYIATWAKYPWVANYAAASCYLDFECRKQIGETMMAVTYIWPGKAPIWEDEAEVWWRTEGGQGIDIEYLIVLTPSGQYFRLHVRFLTPILEHYLVTSLLNFENE
jgi:hypothetical protein